MRFVRISLLFLILPLLLLPSVQCHSPLFGGGNDSLESALRIADPEKSWAVFAELPGGGKAHYYAFEIREGGRIHFVLQTSPESGAAGFIPSVALIGPLKAGVVTEELFLEVPSGYSVEIIEGVAPEKASYEGFTPSAFYRVAGYSAAEPESGTYYLAVFDDKPGAYSLALGQREEFTLLEWVTIPFSQLRI